MEVEVVNMRACKDWGKPGDVRIDRQTPYGNPFYMRFNTDAERIRVINLYEEKIITKPNFITEELLRAKRLGCWCKPLPCHGDVIKRYIKEMRYG